MIHFVRNVNPVFGFTAMMIADDGVKRTVRCMGKPSNSKSLARIWRTVRMLALCLSATGVSTGHAQLLPGDTFRGLSARFISGGVPGGRATSIAADQSNPDVLYVGGATSGVWKTENGGMTWRPMFDDQSTSSIGTITVHQKNPNIVWVGTGEGKPRYGTGVGTGIFKSIDGGETWKNMGLEESERIQRIRLHPDNPDIVYAAAIGPAYADGEQRGVFKSTDGGQSWRRVLFTNAGAGAADLAMDPANPKRLLAAMWEFRRKPWDFNSGGPGSGLFLSEDAGETWKRLTAADGLPAGDLGRIGLAFDPSEPSRVFASIEAERGGLYRSSNGGRTWSLHNDDPLIFGHYARAWYCQELAIDPNDGRRLYYSAYVSLSSDGGASFRSIVRDGDLLGVAETHQALFLDKRPGHFYVATDQGLIETRDDGKTWRRFRNLPFAQYYQISVDNETPYNVYGNLQDMADYRTPSETFAAGGLGVLPSYDVFLLAGGEQGHVYPHPDDSSIVYTSSQQGSFKVHDLKNRIVYRRPPIAAADGPALRFNVHTGQAVDPFDGDTVYLGSQFLHRSQDRGKTWDIISPDLTTNDPSKQMSERQAVGGLTQDSGGGERHTAIVSIAPSPARRGVIWTGSDDGKVHVTRNDGRTWTDVSDAITGAPKGSWINHIEPSLTDPAKAYVVIDNHRRGDLKPYAFYTEDYGDTWRSVVSDKTIRGNAYVLVADVRVDDLLFLGTEFGLYVSLDGGANWHEWRAGLPTASVRDLVVHPREADLVIGTFGRGLFIIDDINALRTAASEDAFLETPSSIAPIKPATQRHRAVQGRLSAFDRAAGANKPFGATITYVGDGSDAPANVEIIRDDEVIARLDGTNHKGLNRVVWDLRHPTDLQSYFNWDSKWSDLSGPLALPGTYEARVVIGDAISQLEFDVRPDPDVPYSKKARAAKIGVQLETLARLQRIDESRAQLAEMIASLEALADENPSLAERARKLSERLSIASSWLFHGKPAQRAFVAPEDVDGMEGLRAWGGGLTARDALQAAYSLLASSRDAPTESEVGYLNDADRIARTIFVRINDLVTNDYAALRQEAASSGDVLIAANAPAYDW